MRPSECEMENGSTKKMPIDQLAQNYFSEVSRSDKNESKLTNKQEPPMNQRINIEGTR